MAAVLGNSQAIGQVYNISGDRYVTFNGLAKACAAAMGKNAEEIEIVNYNPKKFDFGKKKPFPLRVQHFYADINKATRELNWQPEYDLVSGLTDSFQNDYLASGRDRQEIDWAIDDQILAQQ
jgi:nucleoside-diphosphate-sugar epimerase